MVERQSIFLIFIYLAVGFQIGIFIHRDIYCSQASRRYPWSVHCKNQDKSAGSCETVWMPHSVCQINVEDVQTLEQHRPNARSISIQQGVCFQKSTLFGKSLQSIRTTRQHVWKMFSICRPFGPLGNTFDRGKDFSEDCPDARSSHPDANLIRIELRCFWRISQKSVRKLDRQSPNLRNFLGLFKPINRGL